MGNACPGDLVNQKGMGTYIVLPSIESWKSWCSPSIFSNPLRCDPSEDGRFLRPQSSCHILIHSPVKVSMMTPLISNSTFLITAAPTLSTHLNWSGGFGVIGGSLRMRMRSVMRSPCALRIEVYEDPKSGRVTKFCSIASKVKKV